MNEQDDKQIKKKRARIVARELKRFYPKTPQTPLHYSTSFELLIAVMLSAQTTDAQVNKVTPVLFETYPAPKDLAQAPLRDIEKIIKSLGFYKNKTKHIKETARVLFKKYDGDLPHTLEGLLELPGVGRKTALIVLGHTTRKVPGIAVDTHVKRLSRKFGLTHSSNPDEIERDLTSLFPQSKWWDISHKLKAYGREESPAHKDKDPISEILKNEEVL